MLYSHYGIYICDQRMIQYEGGIGGKLQATIEAVTLEGSRSKGTRQS